MNALLTTGSLSTPIPTAGKSIVQVIDDQRRVLDVSVGADMLVPLLTPAELTRALRETSWCSPATGPTSTASCG